MARLDENGKIMSITKVIMNLEADINSSKAQLKNFYLNLGESFYKDNADNSVIAGAYNELFSQIKQCEDAISAASAKIEELKCIKVCTNCGAEIIEGADFCVKCGSRIEDNAVPQPPVIAPEQPTIVTEEPADEPQPKRCPTCNAVLEEDAQFCTECGCHIEYMPNVSNNICGVCGFPFEEDSRFCTNCGAERK